MDAPSEPDVDKMSSMDDSEACTRGPPGRGPRTRRRHSSSARGRTHTAAEDPASMVMHGDPQIANVGRPQYGFKLHRGMLLALGPGVM